MQILEKDFKSFFEVPFHAYPKNFPYISMMKSDLKRFLSTENPLFRSPEDFTYFTAVKDGKPVGRIVAHIHHASNQHFNIKQSYFGFFDVINDSEVAGALLKKAEDFGRKHGCNEIVGNFNLTAMQQMGVITKIFVNEHYSDQVFAPEYVADLLAQGGYEKHFPMHTHDAALADIDPEKLISPKQRALLTDPEYSFENLTKVSMPEILEAMRICLNDGFAANPMFVPLTKEEIDFQAKDLSLVLDKNISVIAKFKGEPVGAIVCIPNLVPFLRAIKSQMGISTLYHLIKFKMKRDSAIIIYYSVLKAHQDRGLNGLMLYRMIKALKERGYQRLGGTWISTENISSLRQAEKLGGKLMHELHLFKKSLTGA